jgi:SNF2 family DNA or RNA helicase
MPQGPKKWTPHNYQRKALKFLLEHGAAALFLDPGLGKTSITLAGLKVLKGEGQVTGALVVAPLRPALTTWPQEVQEWADFKDLSLVTLHGPKMAKLAEEDHDIYVINYEGLAKLFTRRRVGKVWKYELTPLGKVVMSKVNVLVFDELSKMKNSNSVRFSLIKPHLKKFDRRWGLTGSPAANGLLDLFGQCYVLDEGRSLGQFITHYRAAYFLPTDDMGYNWRVKEGGEEAIHARLKPLAISMSAKDYLELPDMIEHHLKFDLSPKVREQYDELDKTLLTMVDSDIITAANAAGASGKCRQVCAGAIYLADVDPVTGAPRTSKGNRKWVLLHDDKLDALEELSDELQGQQLLVAYEFHHDLERLQKRFPGVPHLGGGVSVKAGKELEARWNAGELRMLFIHPASGALGLNLQKSHAQHIAWFTTTWDFELYDQMIKRLLRQGNKAKQVFVYHFVARDTVDEDVCYALRRKDKTQRSLMDALEARRLRKLGAKGKSRDVKLGSKKPARGRF